MYVFERGEKEEEKAAERNLIKVIVGGELRGVLVLWLVKLIRMHLQFTGELYEGTDWEGD